MLLKSIELENFRQFRHERLDFALGNYGKNVSIIIGENGTGKTTFAQAFFWCMYGETEFTDKSLLNKTVEKDLTPSQEATVKVTLRLLHGNNEYTLTRLQSYKREYTGKVKGDNSVFDIARKDSSGNTEYVKKVACESEVKSILPKELSKYFFFDGERIEKMSKDITTGKKSDDFADAVKGLLGLNAMLSAIRHLKSRSKNSVIGSYENSFDYSSNEKIFSYTDIINKCEDKIEEIDLRLEEIKEQISDVNTRIKEKTYEIRQYADGEKFQQNKEDLLNSINRAENLRSTFIKELCKNFNRDMNNFFSISLIYRALKLIKEKNLIEKDIPYMHTKTIEYLLDKKICICGTHLDEGSVPYQKVKELIEYLPPQSISTTVRDFKQEAKKRANSDIDLIEEINDKFKVISEQDDDIIEKNEELHQIEIRLNGEDVQDKVRIINNEIQECERLENSLSSERDVLLQEKGKLEQESTRADSERRNLTLLDEKNKSIEIYKAYAEKIYVELSQEYASNEIKIREKLEQTINDIFKKIYDGGLSLTIDDKYRISVYVNDYEGDVETSSAQSVAVIFAFITAIIKMAKDNQNLSDDDANLLSSEIYPLVMDAPLSTFDKRRIKAVCEALPTCTEQIIIFIKDTDGDIAEKYLGDKIGCCYKLEKLNEFETILKQE